jgi:hypothetical protein
MARELEMPRVELLTQNGRPAGQLESKLRHLVIGQEEAIQQFVFASSRASP